MATGTKATASKEAATKAKPAKAKPASTTAKAAPKAAKPNGKVAQVANKRFKTQAENDAFNAGRRLPADAKNRSDRKAKPTDLLIPECADKLTKALGRHVGNSAVQNHVILGNVPRSETYKAQDGKRRITAKGYQALLRRLSK